MMSRCEVAIVGAGLSGLMAARHLTQAGMDVQVVEAQDRVSALTVTVPGGDTLGRGGQWPGPAQDQIYKLCRELGLATYPCY